MPCEWCQVSFLLVWLLAALLLSRAQRRPARLAAWLFLVAASGYATSWDIVAVSTLPPALSALILVIQATGAAILRLAWLPPKVHDEAVATLGTLWLGCALLWLSLVQAEGVPVLACAVALLPLTLSALWYARRRAVFRHGGTAATIAFAATFGLLFLWTSRDLFAALVLPPQPIAGLAEWVGLSITHTSSPTYFPVDPDVIAMCALGLLLLRFGASRCGVRSRAWLWPCLLAGLCTSAQMGHHGVPLAVTVALALLATRAATPAPRRTALVLCGVALVLPVAGWWVDFLWYAAHDRGNGLADRPASAEGFNLTQRFTLSRMQPGTVLQSLDLTDLLPLTLRKGRPPHLDRMRLDPLKTVPQPVDVPRWLVYSNNPEVVPQSAFTTPTVVLCRADVAAGDGRIFASHFNPDAVERSLVVAFTNRGTAPCSVRRTRRALMTDLFATAHMSDCGTMAWRTYSEGADSVTESVAAGATTFDRIDHLLGNGIVMEDVHSDQPLTIAVGLTQQSAEAARDALLGQAVTPRIGSQSRGLFATPDERLPLDVDLDDGHLRVALLSATALVGRDDGTPPGHADRLAGRYGCITRVSLHFHRSSGSPWTRAVVLLVPIGGGASALFEGRPRVIHAYGALVLANETVSGPRDFDFEHSLPANGYGPVALVVIPLKR